MTEASLERDRRPDKERGYVGGVRSVYLAKIDGAVRGFVTFPYGWGGSWDACIFVASRFGVRTEDLHPASVGMGYTFKTKEEALHGLVAYHAKQPLLSEEEALAEVQEDQERHRLSQIEQAQKRERWRAEEEVERAARKAHLDECLAGLTETMERGDLTNFQRSMIGRAIELLRKE